MGKRCKSDTKCHNHKCSQPTSMGGVAYTTYWVLNSVKVSSLAVGCPGLFYKASPLLNMHLTLFCQNFSRFNQIHQLKICFQFFILIEFRLYLQENRMVQRKSESPGHCCSLSVSVWENYQKHKIFSSAPFYKILGSHMITDSKIRSVRCFEKPY